MLIGFYSPWFLQHQSVSQWELMVFLYEECMLPPAVENFFGPKIDVGASISRVKG